MLISIITPSFNRAHTLQKLYDSLIEQDFKDFEWILVDDGSIDETKQLALNWLKEDRIKFRFFSIQNGGKTRAVDFAFSQSPKGVFTFVLDSDDYLSKDSLSIISHHLVNLSNKQIGIVGLKLYSNGLLVGGEFRTNEGSYIDIYYGKKSTFGDKLFVINTEIYKDSIVLPFDNEKYMPDNIPFINASNYGHYKLINEIFYIGDYLEEGMTSNTKMILINNIKGHVFEKRELQKSKLLFKYKLLNTVYYIYFCFLSKMTLRETLTYSGDKILTSLLYFPTLAFLRVTGKIHFTL